MVPAIIFTFAAGVCTGWVLRAPATRAVLSRSVDVTLPTGTSGNAAESNRPVVDRDSASSGTPPSDRFESTRGTPTAGDPGPVVSSGDPLDALRAKALRLPIDNADVKAMQGQFGDRRDSGARGHEAVDILAPRGTPVHAVDDGSVARLFLSKLGGITVYQFDPTGRFCYYYAHLERYAEGLRESQQLSRGDVIGYVGTSGNAPPDTPHLHFAIFALTPERHWWEGSPLDPWPVFSH
jgi:murein DD-endopeptidase MepM/ murein hydrolase activator NlpD